MATSSSSVARMAAMRQARKNQSAPTNSTGPKGKTVIKKVAKVSRIAKKK